LATEEAKGPAILQRGVSTRGICAELAAFAATPEEREHLLLESTWIKFAAELESVEAFLKTMDEIDLKKLYPPEAA
jgi:hypothetical protein